MWLPALAIAGAPLTSGMVAKVLLKAQTVNAPDPWGWVLQTLLPLSALATTVLLGRFLILLAQPGAEASGQSSPAGLVWPWALLVASALLLPWWAAPEVSGLWSQGVVIGSLWPVLLGAVVVLAAVLRSVYRPKQLGALSTSDGRVTAGYSSSRIPPGDVLVPISHVLALALGFGSRLADVRLPGWRDVWLASLRRLWSSVDWLGMVERIEFALNRWRTVLVVLLLIGLGVAWLGNG